jgi:dienelactone hydrolase
MRRIHALRSSALLLGTVLVSVVIPPAARATGAAGERYVDLVFAETVTTKNVQYGSAPSLTSGAPERLIADVLQPAGDTATMRPALVVVHGGGFSGGSKENIADVASEWARRGYVVFNINYRLDPGNRCQDVQDERLFPAERAVEKARCFAAIDAAKQDAKQAVRQVRVNASQLRVDPTRIAFLGSSAGAITAMHAAADSDAESRVGAVLSMSGCNYAPETISADDPPVSNIHADRDSLVPYQCAVDNDAAARALGIVSEPKYWYGESSHAGALYRKYQTEIDVAWTAFLKRHLRLGGRLAFGSMTEFSGRPNRSAVVSLVAADTAEPGYLQVLACSATGGATSNLNSDLSGQTRAGLAMVRFDNDGRACVYNAMGTHVVVDLQGYLTDNAFEDLVDERLLDTRNSARPAAQSVTVVRGAPNRSAVVSLVATRPASAGWVQALPCNVTPGGTSNLNIDASDQTRSTLAIVPFDANGTACIFTSVTTDVVVDLQGYLATGSFEDITDQRVLDTRTSGPTAAATKTKFRGRPGSSAFVSVTATDSQEPGWLQVLSCDAIPGSASNLNVDSTGLTIAGAAVVRFDESGEACVYTSMSTHVIVDLQGYFANNAFEDVTDSRLLDTRR